MSCFAFSPYRGSEAAVGWHFATGLAREHEVTVLCGDTRANGATLADVERWRREGPAVSGLDVVYVPPTKVVRALDRAQHLPGCWYLYYQAYRLWQKSALAEARLRHRENPFDIAHHVTIIGYREPGYLWQLGIPWFWGPISGAPMMPWAFVREMDMSGKLRWGLRNPANWLNMRVSRRCAAAARAAAKIWVVTPEDMRMVENLWKREATPMLETGTMARPGARAKSRARDRVLRFAWSGFFHPRKALLLFIRAIGAAVAGGLRRGEVRFDILGKGGDEAPAKCLAARLGIAELIKWHGFLPQNHALEILATADVLVHTAIMEGTPHVVLEALSLGLPVICHDSCGMGTAVDHSCGIKIPLVNPPTSTNGFSAAIHRNQTSCRNYPPVP